MSRKCYHFLVLYDITNNRNRTKVMQLLKKEGCTRIQKSAYVGTFSQRTRKNIMKLIKDRKLYTSSDSIIFIRINTSAIEDGLEGSQLLKYYLSPETEQIFI